MQFVDESLRVEVAAISHQAERIGMLAANLKFKKGINVPIVCLNLRLDINEIQGRIFEALTTCDIISDRPSMRRLEKCLKCVQLADRLVCSKIFEAEKTMGGRNVQNTN